MRLDRISRASCVTSAGTSYTTRRRCGRVRRRPTSATERASISFELQMNVVDGIYQIGMDLHYQDLTCYYDRLESAATVVVHGGEGAKGVADLGCRFRFASLAPESDAVSGVTLYQAMPV